MTDFPPIPDDDDKYVAMRLSATQPSRGQPVVLCRPGYAVGVNPGYIFAIPDHQDPGPSILEMRDWLAANPNNRIEENGFGGWRLSTPPDGYLDQMIDDGCDPNAPHPGYRLTTIITDTPQISGWTREIIAVLKRPKAVPASTADLDALHEALEAMENKT